MYDNEYMHVVTLFYLRFLRLVPSKYLSQLTQVPDLDPSRATPTVPRQTVNSKNHSNRNHNNRNSNNRPVNHPVLQIRLTKISIFCIFLKEDIKKNYHVEFPKEVFLGPSFFSWVNWCIYVVA